MTAQTAHTAPSTTTDHGTRRKVLWGAQILLAAFLLIASGLPKLVGQADAVETFTQIGWGQWFRYVTGIVEVAGAIGLLIPRLAGLAATGLIGLMGRDPHPDPGAGGVERDARRLRGRVRHHRLGPTQRNPRTAALAQALTAHTPQADDPRPRPWVVRRFSVRSEGAVRAGSSGRWPRTRRRQRVGPRV